MVSRCWWCYCKSLYQIEGWEADWNLITICASLPDCSWKRHLWCYQSGMIKAIDWKYSTNLRENTTKSTGLFFPNIGGLSPKHFNNCQNDFRHSLFITSDIHHLRGWWMSEVMNVGVMNVGQSARIITVKSGRTSQNDCPSLNCQLEHFRPCVHVVWIEVLWFYFGSYCLH